MRSHRWFPSVDRENMYMYVCMRNQLLCLTVAITVVITVAIVVVITDVCMYVGRYVLTVVTTVVITVAVTSVITTVITVLITAPQPPHTRLCMYVHVFGTGLKTTPRSTNIHLLHWKRACVTS